MGSGDALGVLDRNRNGEEAQSLRGRRDPLPASSFLLVHLSLPHRRRRRLCTHHHHFLSSRPPPALRPAAYLVSWRWSTSDSQISAAGGRDGAFACAQRAYEDLELGGAEEESGRGGLRADHRLVAAGASSPCLPQLELTRRYAQICFTATVDGHIDYFNQQWYAPPTPSP